MNNTLTQFCDSQPLFPYRVTVSITFNILQIVQVSLAWWISAEMKSRGRMASPASPTFQAARLDGWFLPSLEIILRKGFSLELNISETLPSNSQCLVHGERRNQGKLSLNRSWICILMGHLREFTVMLPLLNTCVHTDVYFYTDF